MIRVLGVVLLVSIGCTPAFAVGAIAVGLSGNVAKNGVSAGTTGDLRTSGIARQDALYQCQRGSAGTKAARAACRVVMTFRNQCAVIAGDPRPGTPGFGWAVSGNSTSAASKALSNCSATAGAARREACRVAVVTCDGTAR